MEISELRFFRAAAIIKHNPWFVFFSVFFSVFNSP